MNKIFKKQAFLYFIIFLSSVSLLKNCIQALSWSSDFQWFPSTLVLEGINHYNYFLDGVIDLTGSGVSLKPPKNGTASISGYDFRTSALKCSDNNYTLFTNDGSSCGTILIDKF